MEGAATATAGAAAAANINLIDLIQQGWYATYPLIFFSVVMMSIVIERFWSLRGLSSGIQNFTEEVCDHLRKGDLPAATELIESFHQMAIMGTGGFAVVAAGISEALIATALGLIVAIIAVIFFNWMQVKIANLDTLLRVGLGKVLEAADLGGVHGAQ